MSCLLGTESKNLEQLPEDITLLESVVIGGVTYQHGVTCECCINQCAYGELEQYCLSAKKRTGPLAQIQSTTRAALFSIGTKPPRM